MSDLHRCLAGVMSWKSGLSSTKHETRHIWWWIGAFCVVYWFPDLMVSHSLLCLYIVCLTAASCWGLPCCLCFKVLNILAYNRDLFRTLAYQFDENRLTDSIVILYCYYCYSIVILSLFCLYILFVINNNIIIIIHCLKSNIQEAQWTILTVTNQKKNIKL